MKNKLPEAAYHDLVQALGEDNISTDPGILETYSYSNGLAQGGLGFQWVFRPVAVTLPASVEEVQAILNICQKYKLKFKAHATAWWLAALAVCPRTVILDMRRMHDLEINVTDSYCINEPYQTAGESQVECMKLGMSPHLVGAGPNASNLASATSMQGTGGTSVRTSMNERNALAVEWVTPSGDILKLGSLNTPGAGWFCGDGPGPSLRGIMRAATGNMGGNGVFTRAAVKLYPWYGPPYECGGTPPYFDSRDIPNSYLRYVVWHDFDKETDALTRLGEAEILDYNNRWATGAFTSSMTITNQEYLEKTHADAYKKFENGYWTFFMHAPSQRALDYRIKTFETIIKDTGGEIIDPMIYGKPSYEIALQNAVRAIWIGKAAYMPTSANTGALPFSYETIDQGYKHALPESLKAKEAWTRQNKILNEGTDNCYVCIDEDGHYMHIEHACLTEPWEPLNEPGGACVMGAAAALEKNFGFFYASIPKNMREMVSYYKYAVKIQRLLDPHDTTFNVVTRSFESILPEEEL